MYRTPTAEEGRPGSRALTGWQFSVVEMLRILDEARRSGLQIAQLYQRDGVATDVPGLGAARSESAKAVLAARPRPREQSWEKVVNGRLWADQDCLRAHDEAPPYPAAGWCERVVHPGHRRQANRPAHVWIAATRPLSRHGPACPGRR